MLSPILGIKRRSKSLDGVADKSVVTVATALLT